jgi:ABC-type multidrug transport system fused ATPase/permease subunit
MDFPEERDSGRDIELKKICNGIQFIDISFSYGSKCVLSHLSLDIHSGEKVVLAGPNGSGKTTLIKLLLGLYEAQGGKILVDSHDISTVSLRSLRERISVVSQNVFLFNDTIRNNILYSRLDATDVELECAARQSGAHDFIIRMEQGYSTLIGERGARLSGGEKQKIAIARALLKDADVFIFDEATAHLDHTSTKAIKDLFCGILVDKICIVISHESMKDIASARTALFKSGAIATAPNEI